jgi:hypothetical protein
MVAAQAETPARRLAATIRGSAFGIDIASIGPLDGLAPTVGELHTTWHVLGDAGMSTMWGERESSAVVDLRYASGRTFLRVDRAEDGLFRIVTPRHGRHLVAADGSEIWSELPSSPPARWQRLLFAQPLPLAASLRGLELFHAGAVGIGDRTVALLAPAGTGKTSVAAHLVAAGAGFVTDDVLALRMSGAAIVAYPGPGRLALAAAELKAVPDETRSRLGPIAGRTDKLILAPRPAAAPGRLGALVFLSRHSRHERLRIVHATAPSPQRLLGSAFLPYLDRPERLLRRLDLCARVATEMPCFEVEIPEDGRAIEVAEALLTHIESL